MVICYCIWWCETGTFWSFWDGGKEVSEVSRPRGFPKVEIPAYVVRSFGSQGLPHWGPLQFFSYLYLHSHTHCSVRKFKEEIMMPEVLVCLSNYWSSNLHDILHNHMGRNLKITFWSLSWTQAGMTKACQIQRSGPGGRGLEPASAFPALWSLPTHQPSQLLTAELAQKDISPGHSQVFQPAGNWTHPTDQKGAIGLEVMGKFIVRITKMVRWRKNPIPIHLSFPHYHPCIPSLLFLVPPPIPVFPISAIPLFISLFLFPQFPQYLTPTCSNEGIPRMALEDNERLKGGSLWNAAELPAWQPVGECYRIRRTREESRPPRGGSP